MLDKSVVKQNLIESGERLEGLVNGSFEQILGDAVVDMREQVINESFVIWLKPEEEEEVEQLC